MAAYPRKTSFNGYLEAVEGILAQPWSDGLPTIPPTGELVDRMVAAGGRAAEEMIGAIPQRQVEMQVWQAATCAVMAGCLPDYFPVVLATWEAMFDSRFNLHAVVSSSGGSAIAAVVSGSYAERIGMQSGAGLFGPGNRANATIGRAIRLGVMSVLKAVPGELDASSFGHAGKYSFHFAENSPPGRWPSVREQLGFGAEETTVTVMAASAPRQIAHRWSPTPEGFVRTLASTMKDPSHNTTGCGATYMVVLGPEHADLLEQGGVGPDGIRAQLSEFSAITESDLEQAGIVLELSPNHFSMPDANGRMLTARPEHILVVTAGGHGSGWSAVIPPFSGLHASHPVTRPVPVPGARVPGGSFKGLNIQLDFR